LKLVVPRSGADFLLSIIVPKTIKDRPKHSHPREKLREGGAAALGGHNDESPKTDAYH
jgi:hypothetical protein